MSDELRFVVSQIDWAQSEYGDDTYLRRVPRSVRIAVFATFDEADADRAHREAEQRKQANPFCYGGEALFYQTSFDAPRLHDWLMDAGIDPPINPHSHPVWADWWDAVSHTWSAEQLAQAWNAFDKVRFFEVTEERPMRKAYVITELNWNWEDEPALRVDYEGGKVVRAFRTRAAAETECERLNRERQAQPDHNGYHNFMREARIGQLRAGPLWIEETIFFEVVEIEVENDS